MIAFDTETTGIDVKINRIVEVGFVERNYKNDEITDNYYRRLINPGIPIPDSAAKVHGITDEIVIKDGHDPKESLDRTANFIAKHAMIGESTVAYNAPYDFGVLKYELERYNLPSIEMRLKRKLTEIIDPYVLDRALDPYRKGSRKLSDVAKTYGINMVGKWHTASFDAQIALDVAEAIFEKFPVVAKMDSEELYDFQESSVREFIKFRNNSKPHKYPYVAKWIDHLQPL